MKCWIYKGHICPDTYLFLAEEGATHVVPAQLLARLGHLQQVMTLELHNERRLARAEAKRVMAALESNGFYLQLPPAKRED